MSKVTLSIIVPVYGVEQYIEKCIRSLIDNAYEDYEIIIVNDGTKDKSIEVIEPIIRENNRIRLINQENQGVSIARNTGIDAATGDYVTFVDPDDWVSSDYLDIIHSQIASGEDVIVFGYKNIHTHDNSVLSFDLEDNAYYESDIVNAIAEFESKGSYLNFLWNKVYKHSVINDTRFRSDAVYCEDLIFNVELFCNIHSVKACSHSYYCYRTSGSSLTNNRFYQNYRELAELAICSRDKLYRHYKMEQSFKHILDQKKLDYRLGELANMYRQKSTFKSKERRRIIHDLKKEIKFEKYDCGRLNKKAALLLLLLRFPTVFSDIILTMLFKFKNSIVLMQKRDLHTA